MLLVLFCLPVRNWDWIEFANSAMRDLRDEFSLKKDENECGATSSLVRRRIDGRCT